MNAEGAKAWARITKENVGKSISIVLDGFIYSFPTGARSHSFPPGERKDKSILSPGYFDFAQRTPAFSVSQ